MDSIIRNTQFDNLVNYETRFSSNSAHQTIAFQSSADPTALSTLSKNMQSVEYSYMISQEKIIQRTDIVKN